MIVYYRLQIRNPVVSGPKVSYSKHQVKINKMSDIVKVIHIYSHLHLYIHTYTSTPTHLHIYIYISTHH